MKYDLSNPLDVQKAKIKFDNFIDKKYRIELKKPIKKKTVKQNAYLHVCIALFSIEFGYTLEEAKIILKELSTFMTYEKKGRIFTKSIAKCSTEEVADFIKFIRNSAAKHGLYIPSAEEYKANEDSIDRDIYNNKQYL